MFIVTTLWLGHVLVVSGDFTVTCIMTVVLCPATASALRGNTGLTELSLGGCGIDAEGTSHLVKALCGITTLNVLNLNRNTVGSQGARHLGKLSGGVWDYGLTGNIRLCQCATSNRERSTLQNILLSAGEVVDYIKTIVLAKKTDTESEMSYLPTIL